MMNSDDLQQHDPTPVPVQAVLDYASPAADAKPRPAMPGLLRLAGMYAGVLVPGACLAFSTAGYPFGPDWQSGRAADYVKLLLWARSGWPFFPLLVYSMVGMALVCGRPAHFARRFWVRLAIYTGVVLAAQFAGIMFLSVALEGIEVAVRAFGGGVVGTVVPAVGLFLIDRLMWRYGPERVWAGVISLVLLAVIGVAAVTGREAGWALIGVPVVGSLFLATPWALAVYVMVAVRVWRLARDEPAGPAAAAAVAWGATYAGAWAMAVEQAIRAYHRLPTNPPSRCYVATAAAGGHAGFVGARDVGGVRVNDQLRRLKCAEIALAVAAPRAHRRLRRAYDAVGPAMAREIRRSRWLADVAYASLKPAEWVAVIVLRRVLRDFDELAAKMYGGGAAVARGSTCGEGPHPGPLPEYRARGKGADAAVDRD